MEMTQGIPKNGLLGYFFEEDNFQSLLFISNGSFTYTKIQPNLDFVRPEQTVKSVRWLGRIKPKKTGYYLFSSSENNYIVLQIEDQNGDEKRVIDFGERDVMELKADTLYSIRFEYQLESPMHIEETNLSLFWELEGQEQELIPDECMYLPDFTNGSGITNVSSTLFRLEASAPEDREEAKCRKLVQKFPCATECKSQKCQDLFNIDRKRCCTGSTYNKGTCGPWDPPKTDPPKTDPPKTDPP
ncbi:PA14 domain-containing protein, partial [Bacillus cereus]|nr:PA14 domain-containing protein [Bacillus cereus]